MSIYEEDPTTVTYVVCVRDPDFSNEFQTFGPANIEVIDLDLGADDLSEPNRYLEWAESHLEWADEIHNGLAREHVYEVVLSNGPFENLRELRTAIANIGKQECDGCGAMFAEELSDGYSGLCPLCVEAAEAEEESSDADTQ